VRRLPDVGESGRTSIAFRSAILVALFTLAAISCSSKRCTCPRRETPTSGRATVRVGLFTDKQGRHFSEGFSFSRGATTRVYLGADPAEIDFFAAVKINSEGKALGVVYLDQADTTGDFLSVGGGPSEEEGRAAFDSLECVPRSPFHGVVCPAAPYRVVLVRTKHHRFGKIFVVDTTLSNHLETPDGASCGTCCGQVTFDWVFQPDGERCFK